jgi:hypothetical protein
VNRGAGISGLDVNGKAGCCFSVRPDSYTKLANCYGMTMSWKFGIVDERVKNRN